MFENSGIIYPPLELPAKEGLSGCYYQMFKGCEKLASVPDILATNLQMQACQ